ncbi:MAG: hypothetical protein II994_01970 [Lachnospiraceae bacterium]|nr:hypothetical protein [Lachnospiraceae bacterium]
MKRKMVAVVMCVLMAGSLCACGERYGEDADFNDVSIYETKWAEKEIATWENYAWAEGSSDTGKFFVDEIEFSVDGHKGKFPDCASKVIENPVSAEFSDLTYTGNERWSNEYAYLHTENCEIRVVVDNNSGEELYQGEMACYRVEIRPENLDNFSMNILGVEVNKDTKASDVIAVLGNPYYTDKSEDLQYVFHKGRVEFCFDKEYENGDFEYAMIYAKGWEPNY